MQRTHSCSAPIVDPLRAEVCSLVVLAAEQVAAHLPVEDSLKLAPLHMHLIRGTGIKRKPDTGKDEQLPTPSQEQKKTKKTE